MRQYLDAKRQHRDAIVFFRMGDFYEMFYEDALVAARALDLTLTSRSKDAVMAPFRATNLAGESHCPRFSTKSRGNPASSAESRALVSAAGASDSLRLAASWRAP